MAAKMTAHNRKSKLLLLRAERLVRRNGQNISKYLKALRFFTSKGAEKLRRTVIK